MLLMDNPENNANLEGEKRSGNIMNKKPSEGTSSPCYSISISLSLTVLCLFAILVFDGTVSPERSWFSLNSPLKLRDVFSGLSSRFVDNNSTYVAQGTTSHPQNVKTESTSPNITSKRKKYTRLERVEETLVKARLVIREAAQNKNMTSIYADPDYVPQGPIYRNANAFHRSYLEMEKKFKMYVYQEGVPPLFHDGPCKGIYTTEGRFITQMERENIYKTKDPNKALVYFLPFSVVMMVHYLYVPGAHEYHAIGRTVSDYVDMLSHKHRFWNQSLGADHIMLSCHDWGPHTSSYVPLLVNNSIRVLCNANTSEGFNPVKDVSFPEINLKDGEITGLLGGPSPSKRPILAFFAGRYHGDIRLRLLEQWKDKDQDVLVYDNNLPKGVSYESLLKKSRFCLCPSGYEVASPRVVEAIYSECVPVLISDGYVPPFSDVLNWKAFSISIPAKDIANIKTILMSISQSRYLRLQRRVKQVQRHFVLNAPSKRYDVFHMTMHSIWLRRLNIHIEDRSSLEVELEN